MPAAPVAALPPWSVSLNSEVRYFSFTGGRGDPATTMAGAPAIGGKGSEVYTPTTLSVTGMINPLWKFEGLIRSGYVSAHQGTPGETATVGTPTDTVPSLTFTYLGFDGVQPFASINLNLPTGKTALYGTKFYARLDPDIVDVPTFGEGLNVGPTVGVNIPFNQNVVGTLSTGYTARGNFNQDGTFSPFFPQLTNRVHPGDLFTLSASITAQAAQWSVQFSANYVIATRAENNDVDQFRAGNQLSFSTVVGYVYNESFSVRAVGSYSLSDNNRTPIFGMPGTDARKFELKQFACLPPCRADLSVWRVLGRSPRIRPISRLELIRSDVAAIRGCKNPCDGRGPSRLSDRTQCVGQSQARASLDARQRRDTFRGCAGRRARELRCRPRRHLLFLGLRQCKRSDARSSRQRPFPP